MSYTAAAERYERMTYNRSGRSGLRLPAVSLGLWWNFGGDRPYAGLSGRAARQAVHGPPLLHQQRGRRVADDAACTCHECRFRHEITILLLRDAS